MVSIKIVNLSGHAIPTCQTPQSAGMDLHAHLETEMLLGAGERMLIPTGLCIELPTGFEAQVRPRSGLAFNHGITVLNSPGTIDSDYRGEIKVLLINHGSATFSIHNGDRIAQLIVAEYSTVHWLETSSLSDTERGQGGYGSTGKTL